MKFCDCGCGQPAPIAKATNRRKGHIKGEPVGYISGHNSRGKSRSLETRRKMRAYALDRSRQHQARLSVAARSRPKVETDNIATIHGRLKRDHPKAGRCEDCGRIGKTDYAFLLHPEQYTENRAHYRELCRSCHTYLDISLGVRPQGAANKQASS